MPSIQTQKKLEEIKSILNTSGTCYDLNDLYLSDKGLLGFKSGGMIAPMHGISITKNATIPYVTYLDCRIYIEADCEVVLPDLEHTEYDIIIKENARLSAPKLRTIAGMLSISNGNIEAPNLTKVFDLYLEQMSNKDFSSIKTLSMLRVEGVDNIKFASPLKLSAAIIANSNIEFEDLSIHSNQTYYDSFDIYDNSVVTVDTLSFNVDLWMQDATLVVNKKIIKANQFSPTITLHSASLIVPSSYEKYLEDANIKRLDQDSNILYMED